MGEAQAEEHSRLRRTRKYQGRNRSNPQRQSPDATLPLQDSAEPGTGKTTLAHIIANTLGWQLHKFNASSKKTRGIEFIEEYIIPMSRIGQWETIFFLDEADRLTPQAQDALKGVIEDAQGYFILTCNDISKVSPWLQSRCQVRTFEPIPTDPRSKTLGLNRIF